MSRLSLAGRLGLLSLVACFAPIGCGDDGDANDTDASTSGSGEAGEAGETGADACAEEFVTKDNADAPDTMTRFGTPCLTDADCSHLGETGECFEDVLGIYELPGGFCSIRCDLPDTSTTFVNDDPQCDAEGGVTCVGAKGLFSACIQPCTEDSNCSREGYGCVRMPTISIEGDPLFCLMNQDECCLQTQDVCTTPP